MNNWLDLLSPMAWPLAIFSNLTLALVLEHQVFFISLGRLTKLRQLNILELANSGYWQEFRNYLDTLQGMTAKGLKLLLTHRECPRARLEHVAALWLTEQRRKRQAHLRLLALFAVASPLFGLLGTILGMTTAIQNLAAHAVPVSSSMMATAIGLVITIPALITSHTFRI